MFLPADNLYMTHPESPPQRYLGSGGVPSTSGVGSGYVSGFLGLGVSPSCHSHFIGWAVSPRWLVPRVTMRPLLPGVGVFVAVDELR